MAKNKKEKKERVFTNDEKRQAGMVEFTMDDVKDIQNRADDDVNLEAYRYMVEAMSISANYMGDTISAAGEVRLDDVYPTTLEETQGMDQLLDKSELAVKDWSDKEYNGMIDTLRAIVGWSAKRHFTFSWLIIFGSIISVLGFNWLSNSDKEYKTKKEALVAKVQAWEAEGDDVLTMADPSTITWDNYLDSPANYKAYILGNASRNLDNANENIANYQAMLDTASSKETRKTIEEWINNAEKSIKKYDKVVTETMTWSANDAKKAALKQTKAELKSASKAAAMSNFFLILFILLIPLYIFSSYSYGYTITRYREEAAFLEKIRKWAYRIAGGLAGTAFAMDAVDTYRVHWSDGSRTTESEVNPLSVALKFLLYAAALIILAVVSSLIMIYSTITGLIRNYNWKAIFSSIKSKGQAVAQPK